MKTLHMSRFLALLLSVSLGSAGHCAPKTPTPRLVNVQPGDTSFSKLAVAPQKEATAADSRSSKAIEGKFVDVGSYLVGMQKKIHEHWKPPKHLKAVVVKWQILPNGTISGLRIDRSSGDPENDKAALDSVALSAPFAPLPAGVDALPIVFTFEQATRSGMEHIPVSERAASLSLSNAAVDLVNNKQLDEALDKLEFAFDRDPRNTHISSVLRAVSAYINDSTPDNVHLLHRVLALDPQQHAAIEKLNILHRARGIDPNSASQRLHLGNQCLKKLDAEGALAEFTAANSIKAGTCPQASLVEAYRVLAGHRMAKKWQTVARYRKDVECLCGLGRSYQLAGDFERAERYYKEALEMDPSSSMARELAAKLDEERKTGIREKVDIVIAEHNIGTSGKGDLIPRAQVLNNEGIRLLKEGNFTAAIDTLKEALRVDPRCEEARANLSAAFNNQGAKLRTEEAIPYYYKALFVHPTNKTARQNLSSFVRYKGKNPDSFADRLRLAEDFAQSGDFVCASVELREALAVKKDAAAQARLHEFLKKAPALP